MKHKISVITIFIFFGVLQQTVAQQSHRISNNWQFLREDLGGVWEAVRPVAKGSPESVPLWTDVTLPHCFNASDAVDPDVNYYQGPGWYKTSLDINNPYDKGRTLLHFEGAGQKTDVYVYTTKAGGHVGGYDEWTVDITDAVNEFKSNDSLLKVFKGIVPVAVRCDNSRDLEMMPSNLSDFNLYGGLYRYLNLVYQPSTYISQLLVQPILSENGKSGMVNLRLQFANPLELQQGELTVRLLSPTGKELQRVDKMVRNFKGETALSIPTIKAPQPWSPATPVLYLIEASVTTPNGRCCFFKTGFSEF